MKKTVLLLFLGIFSVNIQAQEFNNIEYQKIISKFFIKSDSFKLASSERFIKAIEHEGLTSPSDFEKIKKRFESRNQLNYRLRYNLIADEKLLDILEEHADDILSHNTGLQREDIEWMKRQAIDKPELKGFDRKYFNENVKLEGEEEPYYNDNTFSNFVESKDATMVVFLRTSPINSESEYKTLFIYKLENGKWVHRLSKPIR